jgi:hypothetical protein
VILSYSFTRVAASGHWSDLNNATSWLDTNGKFYPITRVTEDTPWVSHGSWAVYHGKRMSEIFEEGWQRVTFIGDNLIASNDLGVPLNWKQKSSLVDLAIANKKFNTVVYENGEGDEHTIWERER